MENLRQEIANMRQSFFDERILDSEFIQLEELEANGNPNFVEEIFTTFYADSTKLLETVTILLEQFPDDCPQVNRLMHQLKGSSSSIGATKIALKACQTRRLFVAGNLEETKASLQELKREHGTLKEKIQTYFQLLRQAGPVETAMPPVKTARPKEETTMPPNEGGNGHE